MCLCLCVLCVCVCLCVCKLDAAPYLSTDRNEKGLCVCSKELLGLRVRMLLLLQQQIYCAILTQASYIISRAQ